MILDYPGVPSATTGSSEVEPGGRRERVREPQARTVAHAAGFDGGRMGP